MQTSDENKEKYGTTKLIQYQILQTNIMRIIWQIVRRITNEILGVEGLISDCNPQIFNSPVNLMYVFL